MKKLLTFIIAFALLIAPLPACGDEGGLKKIELNEVTHSVFYAPLYVAIENGYFEEEGLLISLTNGGGADNSMTAVLSKTADIGLMGPETVIYVQNQKKADAPVVFGQLTQKDGAFWYPETKNRISTGIRLRAKRYLRAEKAAYPL